MIAFPGSVQVWLRDAWPVVLIFKIIRTTFWSRYDKGLRDDDPDRVLRSTDGHLRATETITTIVSSAGDAEMTTLVEANGVDTSDSKHDCADYSGMTSIVFDDCCKLRLLIDVTVKVIWLMFLSNVFLFWL
jgi:hypothetical protein